MYTKIDVPVRHLILCTFPHFFSFVFNVFWHNKDNRIIHRARATERTICVAKTNVSYNSLAKVLVHAHYCFFSPGQLMYDKNV